MDAPFHVPPRIADESRRSKGRSELQFAGYNESRLKDTLLAVLEVVRSEHPGVTLVVQIARGRASAATFAEVIEPLLLQSDIKCFHVVSGYRSSNYYRPSDAQPFVFLNYGMFAVLRDGEGVDALAVGELCNPVAAVGVQSYDTATGQFGFEAGCGEEEGRICFQRFDDEKNLLRRLALVRRLGVEKRLREVALLGLADHMSFVTPTEYNGAHVSALLQRIL